MLWDAFKIGRNFCSGTLARSNWPRQYSWLLVNIARQTLSTKTQLFKIEGSFSPESFFSLIIKVIIEGWGTSGRVPAIEGKRNLNLDWICNVCRFKSRYWIVYYFITDILCRHKTCPIPSTWGAGVRTLQGVRHSIQASHQLISILIWNRFFSYVGFHQIMDPLPWEGAAYLIIKGDIYMSWHCI